MRQVLLCGTALSMLFLGGCSLHDIDFNPQPKVAVSHAYSDQGSDTVSSLSWWEGLDRPELNLFIAQALSANQDLAAAVARIEQARALTTQTQSDLFPKIDGSGDIGDSWRGTTGQTSTKSIGADVSWEIDLFGRISSAAKADKMTAEARVEDMRALRLSISAEVAEAYFGAVAARERLKLLNHQLKTDQELLDLIVLRKENGIGTNVEVLQQKSRVAESKSLIPPTESGLRIFENRLDVLLGEAPDGTDRVNADDNLDFADALPFIGVPVDLLMNRPDLRAAKAELIAADADIASAIADRLPQITLDGSYSYTDTASFSGPLAVIAGSFVQPLLDWGERKAEVERNKAIYREKLAEFTQIYLEAIEEVENALYQERKQREYITRLNERREILNATLEETEALYTQGVDDYLPVLNALQELRDVERNLVTERQDLMNARIALYRSVGGKTQEQGE